jgi:predicted DNA-binding antitoxin AbrB/MazE fold protein
MTITVEAVYENGMLKPTQPLPLREHQTVLLTIQTPQAAPPGTAGIIDCADPQLIEWAAMDAELEYPPPTEER